VAITSFTQQPIIDSNLQFVHDGGETAPAYSISVSDGALSTTAAAASITFTSANDTPVLAEIRDRSIDENATLTDSETFTVTVGEVNEPPVIVNDGVALPPLCPQTRINKLSPPSPFALESAPIPAAGPDSVRFAVAHAPQRTVHDGSAYGMGFTSLSLLANLPLDVVKIDRSFIVAMANGERNCAVVGSIFSMAHALDLRVVGEGIETDEQPETMARLGCDELQGYLISRPLPADQISAFLLHQRSERERRRA